jgi:hypothetical protein
MGGGVVVCVGLDQCNILNGKLCGVGDRNACFGYVALLSFIGCDDRTNATHSPELFMIE